jgi:hypothetical protein
VTQAIAAKQIAIEVPSKNAISAASFQLPWSNAVDVSIPALPATAKMAAVDDRAIVS